MVQEPDRIKQHIAHDRIKLGQELEELGSNLRRASDWKVYVRRYPMLAVGAALGAGFLIAGMSSSTTRAIGGPETKRQVGTLNSRIDSLVGAALNFGSDRLTDLILDAFPALRSRYQQSA